MAPEGWRADPGLAQRLRSMTITYGRLRSGEPRPAPRCPEDDPTPEIATGL